MTEKGRDARAKERSEEFDMSDSQRNPRDDDIGLRVAIIGGGTAAETLVAELDGSGLDVIVFEDDRVGGECPFVACMPTKAMLHDAAVGRSWAEAVRRRDQVVEQLDDAQHAADLAGNGATLVRSRASIIGPGQGRRRRASLRRRPHRRRHRFRTGRSTDRRHRQRSATGAGPARMR